MKRVISAADEFRCAQQLRSRHFLTADLFQRRWIRIATSQRRPLGGFSAMALALQLERGARRGAWRARRRHRVMRRRRPSVVWAAFPSSIAARSSPRSPALQPRQNRRRRSRTGTATTRARRSPSGPNSLSGAAMCCCRAFEATDRKSSSNISMPPPRITAGRWKRLPRLGRQIQLRARAAHPLGAGAGKEKESKVNPSSTHPYRHRTGAERTASTGEAGLAMRFLQRIIFIAVAAGIVSPVVVPHHARAPSPRAGQRAAQSLPPLLRYRRCCIFSAPRSRWRR